MAAWRYNLPGSRNGQPASRLCYVSEGRVIAGSWGGSEREALQRMATLEGQRSTPMDSGNDRSWLDGDDYLIEVAESPTTASLAILATDAATRVNQRNLPSSTSAKMAALAADIAPPLKSVVLLHYRLLRTVTVLWKQSE